MADVKLQFFGKVTDGKLTIVNRKQFDSELHHFEGKEVMLTLERKKKKRSNEQNRYWWGCVIPLVKEGLNNAGYKFTLNEQVHEQLKKMFLTYEDFSEKTGVGIERTHDTKSLTTSEFMDLIATVQQWSAEFLGVEIPNPGEQLKIE